MQISLVEEDEPDLNNKFLCEENISLKSQLKDLKSSVVQLKDTIANLEMEKASLLTSLKILQEEQTGVSIPQNSKSLGEDKWETVKEAKTKKKKKRKAKSKKKQTSDSSDKHKPTTKENQQTTVVVAGDSIIKFVKGWELSNAEQKVSVKSFAGATVDDMGDFIKPTIRKHPDKLVIHAGTNDVRSSSPRAIADKVTELAEHVEQESSDTRVIISSLVTRSDNQELARKVKETNIILKSNCNLNNWLFLDNSNISRSHLNHRGLHLNHEGSALLQKNIANILKSQD